MPVATIHTRHGASLLFISTGPAPAPSPASLARAGLLPASLARAGTEREGHGDGGSSPTLRSLSRLLRFFPGASLPVPASSQAHRPDPASRRVPVPRFGTRFPVRGTHPRSRSPAANSAATATANATTTPPSPSPPPGAIPRRGLPRKPDLAHLPAAAAASRRSVSLPTRHRSPASLLQF